MLQRITDMAQELACEQAVLGVGLSIPGSLDSAGILRNAPNSPAIDGSPLPADLALLLPFPLVFENDANCLALSEFTFGAARGFDFVVAIILGTGVGGGVILDGKILHGSSGLAPEIGHIPLDVKGRLCPCGNLGCVEAYLSGPSLLRRYRDAGGAPSVLDTPELFLRSADPIALQILAETGDLFARFIATLVSLYDPDVFVLGGGLSLQPMFYQLQERIAELCFGCNQPPLIRAAQRGDASGKLGAASLVFQQLSL